MTFVITIGVACSIIVAGRFDKIWESVIHDGLEMVIKQTQSENYHIAEGKMAIEKTCMSGEQSALEWREIEVYQSFSLKERSKQNMK